MPLMPVFDFRFIVDAPLDAVRRFHGSPKVLSELTPPPLRVQVYQFGEMEDGMIARFALCLGPLTVDWEARHEDVSENGFTDIQVSGPLKSWRHSHRFTPLTPRRTEIHEHVEYEFGDGLRGFLNRLMFGRAAVWLLFTYRRRVTRLKLAKES